MRKIPTGTQQNTHSPCSHPIVYILSLRTQMGIVYFLLEIANNIFQRRTIIIFSTVSILYSDQSETLLVLFNSLWPHGLYSPWNSLGQNTGVCSLSILQGIFPTQESNQHLLHCRWILHQLSYQGSPTWETHGLVITPVNSQSMASCETALL